MKEKILVIDDEKVILQLTSMILKNRGYAVKTAESGPDGLEILEKEHFPLVLLDYMMPVMNGMTVLQQIRENHPKTYVIMFTGKGSEEVAVELMKAGASDYVLKPFNNQDLLDRIENVLRIRRIELHNKELRAERERLLREIEEWNQELENRVAQKSAELEQAQMEIIQAEKLAALGHLSGGMAHEIRNPLNSISLFAQILHAGLQGNSDLKEYPEKILTEVDRIDDILIKLLNASRRPRGEMRRVSVAEEVDRALAIFDVQIAAQGIRVVKNFQTTPPPIEADPQEIAQIFNNIIANSLYEMQHGGELRIEVNHDPETIMVDISDTGGGVPEENLYRIFDPFFTTKSRGTGLGLSVVLRIVNNYGGKVKLDSLEGEGTTFHIRLPVQPPVS